MPEITVTPDRAVVDVPLDIHLKGFEAGQSVTIKSTTTDAEDVIWTAHATYTATADGTVNLNAQAPESGTFDDADPMGLIWSMTPQDDEHRYAMFARPADLAPLRVRFEAQVNGETVAETVADRLHLADRVKRVEVRENGLFGVLFLPDGEGPHPAITIVSGSGGGLFEYRAALFAAHGYAAFALAYFNYETLPKILVDIPLEYFEKAIHYLQSRDDIDGDRMAITGGSRGGELSLLLGSLFPQFKAVIANVPSGIVWGGFGHNPAEGNKPAWRRGEQALPYMDAEFDPEIYAYYGEYTERGEAIPGTPGFRTLIKRNPEIAKKAEIPVEKINGAVLMISGEDDQMWPSTELAEIAMQRLKAYNFDKPYSHLSYPNAGHLITPPFGPTTIIDMKHPVDGGFYTFGGEPSANYHAGRDSWHQILDFLKANL